MECLFGWDTKKQRGTVGILGIVEAFCQAIEEQGRGSLHGHFLVWIKGFALMRSMIYSKDEAVKNEAKKTYIKYVDQVMSATYGKFPLDMGTPTHVQSAPMKEALMRSMKTAKVYPRAMLCKKTTNRYGTHVTKSKCTKLMDS